MAEGLTTLFACGDVMPGRGLDQVLPHTGTGRLAALRMVPIHARKTRLSHATPADSPWLARTLNWISRRFGARIECRTGGTLELRTKDPPTAGQCP